MSSSSEIRGKLRSSIAKLVDKKLEVPTKDSYELWANFWVLPNSIEDLQAVFQPADIRFIRDHSAEGFSGLILSVSTHLIYLSKIQNEKLKDFPTSEFLNCVRLLTILFPFIYEKKQSNHTFENELFWNKVYDSPNYSHGFNSAKVAINDLPSLDGLKISVNNAAIPNLIDVDADPAQNNDKTSDSNINNNGLSANKMNCRTSIGAELVFACLNALFTLGFTVESWKTNGESEVLANDYQSIVWEPGLEQAGLYLNPVLKMDSNRLEILRLMITLFSKPLYAAPSEANMVGSRFLTVLVAATDQMKFHVLFLSLWNTISRSLKPNDDTEPNKNGLEFQSEEQKNLRLLLVTNSIQLFTLMISYSLPKKDLVFLFKYGILGGNPKEIPINRARFFLHNIGDTKQLREIVQILSSALLKPMIDRNNNGTLSYLMKSSKLIEDKDIHIWGTELMMILLEFYQCNNRFRLIFAEMVGPEFFILLVYYIVKFRSENKEKKYKNFIKLSIYILLIFSGDVRLTSKLLVTFDMNLYDSLPQLLKTSTLPTSYRDFLILHICDIIGFDLSYSMLLPLFQALYNLVNLQVFIYEFNKRNNREPLANRRMTVRDLRQCPPSQISYSASTSLIQLITKLVNSSEITNDPDTFTDYIAILLIAFCQAILRNPSDHIFLLFVICRDSSVFGGIRDSIKRISDQLELDLNLKEKKEFELNGPETDFISNPISNTSVSLQNNRVPSISENYESKDSLDMPSLSRQNTQNTLESIPSTRSLPVLSKQTSQISIPLPIQNTNNQLEEGVDPMSIGSVKDEKTKTTDLDDDSPVASVADFVFYAELPVGMSERGKGKRAYYETFCNKWSGKYPLNIIEECIKVVSSVVDCTKNNKISESSIIIQQLFRYNFEELFSGIEKPDMFRKDQNDYRPLRFRWDNNSLGWYFSLIWADIFLNYKIHTSKGILAEISSGFSVIKRVSTSWGFGSWKLGSSDTSNQSANLPSPLTNHSFTSFDINQQNSKTNDQEVYYDNILKKSIWFGTHIELFRVNPAILRDHFILQHGKSEHSNSIGFNSSYQAPSGNEIFWRRNSSAQSPIPNIRNGSGVFTEGFWKRQGGRPASLDRRDSDGSLKLQLSRNGN